MGGIIDNYPLMESIENYEIIRTIWEDGDGDGEQPIPGYNLFILLGILSVVTILITKKVKKS